MKILILGVSGMLGHMLFAEMLEKGFDVYGASRRSLSSCDEWQSRLTHGMDARDLATVVRTLDTIQPDVCINAVGLIRHLPEGREALPCILMNAALPHQLAGLCKERQIRFIHYSTDCVFDGKAGRPYTEEDRPTAPDIYGLTKFLGEVDSPNCLTIRTSIIGPELRGRHSLLEWFLSQGEYAKGYTRAIYTGLPTSEQARLLAEYILPAPTLHGVYHVAADPISKYELLGLIAEIYGKKIHLAPDPSVREDKRLSGTAFQQRTGYTAPSWPQMITAMHQAHQRNKERFKQYV